jgi:hypothetical protein
LACFDIVQRRILHQLLTDQLQRHQLRDEEPKRAESLEFIEPSSSQWAVDPKDDLLGHSVPRQVVTAPVYHANGLLGPSTSLLIDSLMLSTVSDRQT